jgi:hypothetical protein
MWSRHNSYQTDTESKPTIYRYFFNITLHVISFHLRLGLHRGLSPLVSCIKTRCRSLVLLACHTPHLSYPIPRIFITLNISDQQYKLRSSSLLSFQAHGQPSHPPINIFLSSLFSNTLKVRDQVSHPNKPQNCVSVLQSCTTAHWNNRHPVRRQQAFSTPQNTTANRNDKS